MPRPIVRPLLLLDGDVFLSSLELRDGVETVIDWASVVFVCSRMQKVRRAETIAKDVVSVVSFAKARSYEVPPPLIFIALSKDKGWPKEGDAEKTAKILKARVNPGKIILFDDSPQDALVEICSAAAGVLPGEESGYAFWQGAFQTVQALHPGTDGADGALYARVLENRRPVAVSRRPGRRIRGGGID